MRGSMWAFTVASFEEKVAIFVRKGRHKQAFQGSSTVK